MARSLSIAAFLMASVVLGVAAAADILNINVGCNTTTDTDVCSTCNSSMTTAYNATEGCHKYSNNIDNSYKVVNGELQVYGTGDCSGEYVVFMSHDTCLGNWTTVKITEMNETDFNATLCLPDTKKVECDKIPTLLWQKCFELPLKPTNTCALVYSAFQVAYTASVADGKLDFALYSNMAECGNKHLAAFIGTGLEAKETCEYYQPRFLLRKSEPGPVTSDTSDSGVSVQGALLAAAFIALTYVISM